MAESMAPSHNPDEKFLKVYTEWAEGDWGMIMTGNVMVSEVYHGSPADIANNTIKSPLVQESWKAYASATQSHGAAGIVQLCHPGRQSPLGAGKRSFFAKTIAPSAVPMDFGPSIAERLASALIFGTPKAMTSEDIDEVVDQFVRAARQCFDAGFKGIELHGAHGYLLAQFLSPRTNLRTDVYGGSATSRAKLIVRIIEAVRAATSAEFCIGIKLNSVDVDPSTPNSIADTMAQIGLIIAAGIDFIEISGGTYENPRMAAEPSLTSESDSSPASDESQKSIHTAARESFFLSFATQVRALYPHAVLMVTGGFRTRLGMQAALESNACDLIGIARPAAVLPRLPKEIILNPAVPDADASVAMQRVPEPWLVRFIVRGLGLRMVGAGWQSIYYASQIQRMGKGEVPVDTRVR